MTGGTPGERPGGKEGALGGVEGLGAGQAGVASGPGRAGQAALTFFTDSEMFSRIRSFTSRGSMAPPPPPPCRRRFPAPGPRGPPPTAAAGRGAAPSCRPRGLAPRAAGPRLARPSLCRGPAAPSAAAGKEAVRGGDGGGGRNRCQGGAAPRPAVGLGRRRRVAPGKPGIGRPPGLQTQALLPSQRP